MSTLKAAISIHSTESFWKAEGLKDPPFAVERYRKAVEQVLKNIGRKQTGSWFLSAEVRKLVTIFPRHPGTSRGTTPWTAALSPLDATLEGMRELACNSKTIPAGSRWPNGQFGTGLGSDCVIFFTPLEYVNKSRPGERQDEVLLHELVHAFRKASGTNACRPWGHQMDTEEEVMAIAIANMYASERGRPLRDNHRAFTALSDPKQWVEQNAAPLLRLWFEQKALCDKVAKQATIPFNPFRDLSPGP